MAKEVKATVSCDGCGTIIETIQQGFLGVYTAPAYPKDWKSMKPLSDDVLCGTCFGKSKSNYIEFKRNLKK